MTIGEGKWTYTLDENWGKLPEGMTYGFGCAVVVDSKDRIYVTSLDEPVRRRVRQRRQAAGNLGQRLRRQGRLHAGEVKATAHGLYWSQEADGEFLYFTENVQQGRPAKALASTRPISTASVLYELGKNVKARATRSRSTSRIRPTSPSPPTATSTSSTATAANSFIASTRTSSTSRRSAARAPTTASSRRATASGSARSAASRRSTSPIGPTAGWRFIRSTSNTSGPSRRCGLPCCFYQHADHLYVPELGARVSIIDANDNVVARLGDGAGVKKDEIDGIPNSSPRRTP